MIMKEGSGGRYQEDVASFVRQPIGYQRSKAVPSSNVSVHLLAPK